MGMGVQGKKRLAIANEDVVFTVDPVHPEADFSDVKDVPVNEYDAALCCIPDSPKIELLDFLIRHKKHVLVEKPLWSEEIYRIQELQNIAHSNGIFCYTAYNHRYEPHFKSMKKLIESGELGEVYNCRMFYGNGTARLVRESAWRDQGAGVLPDLASHLLDTSKYWFGDVAENFNVVSSSCFENKSPDHVVIRNDQSRPKLELEMTLLQWKNHFTCDVLAEKGSAHIESLCKWGPAKFIHRRRVFPSGVPTEVVNTLSQPDPTWEEEYMFFKEQCLKNAKTCLKNDIWLGDLIQKLSKQALDLTGDELA